ncbi:MAG: LysM peptidoglycan-binding domain-containing protein [Clostridia bacterium]|nr:LysM peptidoglycan-binding domain-containing protein [Clostridia bacterium]
MYMLYLDDVLFPVAPGKIVTESETDNRIYALIDGSRVVKRGGCQLKKISFDLLLPMKKYPFAYYDVMFYDGEYYMEKLERMIAENVPVSFDLYRSIPGSDVTYLTSMKVLVEKVVKVEDALSSPDITVSVVLREYRSVQTKVATAKSNSYKEREDTYVVPETYTVKSGDSLWMISRSVYGDGAKYTYLAEINGIKKPYTIYAGQKLKLRE